LEAPSPDAVTSARAIAEAARRVASQLAVATTDQKNQALRTMAEKLGRRKDDLLAANRTDQDAAAEAGVPENLIKRLGFGEKKLRSRQVSLEKIAALPDPIGQPFVSQRLPNGLQMQRVRVPLGVILMVFEARPHVTVNAGAFCLKSGNAAILRGGSEARRCNALLGELWQESLTEAGLPPEAIQVVSGSHEEIREMLQLDNLIDLVIPRGGKRLIEAVARSSRIPVIKHYEGICHVYLDEGCDLQQGLNIALDSKCLMPAVCNAMETLLVSQKLVDRLPEIVQAFIDCGVTVRGCPRTVEADSRVEPATEEDWRSEYLDLIVSIRVVDDLGGAIDHINRYGSHHTDSIVTNNLAHGERFLREVDSSVVLINAATMFCDGESLGMGAEIGISTDKLHARGPMGLEELTSYKFVIHGEGHIMGPKRYRTT